jgi:hypothetical protein
MTVDEIMALAADGAGYEELRAAIEKYGSEQWKDGNKHGAWSAQSPKSEPKAPSPDPLVKARDEAWAKLHPAQPAPAPTMSQFASKADWQDAMATHQDKQPAPEPKPLNVVEIMRLWMEAKGSIVDFARAVLAAQEAKK